MEAVFDDLRAVPKAAQALPSPRGTSEDSYDLATPLEPEFATPSEPSQPQWSDMYNRIYSVIDRLQLVDEKISIWRVESLQVSPGEKLEGKDVSH